MDITVGFIGLGLIGGSIAKSLKKADSSIYTIAYNRSQEPLKVAVNEGVIDESVFDIDGSFSKCNIIFLCTPVEYNSIYLEKLSPYISEDCIITDVGSVKGYIHNTVTSLNLTKNFIGGHPMAGSEKTGYEASSDILLENAYYAITPTKDTVPENLKFYTDLVTKMGAIPIIVDPDTHDYAVAGISHVPHLIASGLVNMVRLNDTSDELMKLLAAGGFKDITRIASSSPEMWSQICSTNSEQISLILSKYIDILTDVKNMVDNNNNQGIYDMFAESREYRNSISIKTKGAISKRFTIFCSIEDKKGALNAITELLFNNHISIRNIEIIHNREFKEGALLIEFYDESAYIQAQKALTDAGYIIYR